MRDLRDTIGSLKVRWSLVKQVDSGSMDSEKVKTDSQVEVNFDGLRNAVTPINLMFDGRLFKDIKGLTSHITQAMKKVNREKPDYQAALTEISLLEAGFNSAVSQWEQKLTGEIQRLKNSVETSQQKSLGATKKISKFQEELTRGRATTRTMPIRIGQVRNQLIHLSGHSGGGVGAEEGGGAKSRLSEKSDKLPEVYRSAAAQILRKVSKRGKATFLDTAIKVLQNVSKPLTELDKEQEVFTGKLYYVKSESSFRDAEQQFVVIVGLNESGSGYALHSIFQDPHQAAEISFEEFDQSEVFCYEPLDDVDIVLQLLNAKFKGDDFKETFQQYSAIRKKAWENKREDKFNPRQLEIHQYLTELVFKFAGIAFEQRSSEVRFVEQVNKALQLRSS